MLETMQQLSPLSLADSLLRICPLDFTVRGLASPGNNKLYHQQFSLPILLHDKAHMDANKLILLWKSNCTWQSAYRRTRQRSCDCEVPGDCHKANWEKSPPGMPEKKLNQLWDNWPLKEIHSNISIKS